MLLKFDNKGKFLLQIGGRTASKGNADTKTVHQSADVFVWPKTNEAFVADGYGNRRVIVFDADTGAFKRMWGAFGNAPIDVPPAPRGGGAGGANAGGGRGATPALDTEGNGSQQFGGPVHAVKVSNDGLVYVADRPNRRVQVFTPDGKYVTQAFINRSGPSPQSAAGLAFSPDEPQQFLYVADYGNSHIAVLDRKSLQLLYQFGQRSEKPGDFQGLHHLAIDSKGNLYTGEVAPGARAQRFVFKGLSNTLPPNAIAPAIPGPASAPQQQHRRRGAGSERCAAHVSGSGSGARRLSAVDQHDGKSVPRHPQLAATGGHQTRRRDRHHPGRQGRHVAASPVGAADSAHRRVGQRRSPVRQRHVRASARILSGPRRQLLGGRQRSVPGQSRDQGAWVSALQVQPRWQGAVVARQGRRLEGRHRYVHRSDRVRDRAQRRHHRGRRALAATDRCAAGWRPAGAAQDGRHVRRAVRQDGHGPGRVHGTARAGVRLAGSSVRCGSLEQPRADLRSQHAVRRRVAALRPAERHRHPQRRHAHRRGLRVQPVHRRSATSAGRRRQRGAQSRMGQRHQDRQREGRFAPLLRPGDASGGYGGGQRGQRLRRVDGRVRCEPLGRVPAEMGEK